MLALEHVGIVVKDLDASTKFYQTLFGEEPLQKTSWRGENAVYVANMMGQPGLTLDAAFFRIPGTQVILEVIQFHNLDDTSNGALRHYQVGGTHLGFYVPSIDALLDRVRAAGSELLGEPVRIEYGPYLGTGGRSATFRDPDDNNLQFMEISGRPGNLPLPAPM
jgi:catechol 2,3-dioxygenase-like lactoylglutathione lyase family enzyme